MSENYQFVDGVRHFAGCDLAAIADEFGTPCFVYDAAGVRERFLAYRDGFAARDHQICYATKANHSPQLLRMLVALDAGFDIVSVGELEAVLKAGADPRRVVFSGVGKQRDELVRALDVGIGCFNIESSSELKQLNDVATQAGQRAPIAIRVNPDVDAHTHPYIATGLHQNKFGVPMDEAYALYARAHSMPGIDVIGIASHIGSQLTDITPIIDATQKVIAMAQQLRTDGIHVSHVDIGGGLGIDYAGEQIPTPATLIQQVCDIVPNELTIKVEPGRSLVGAAGALLTRVLIIKRNGDDQLAKKFVIVDAAMNDLMRPALYNAVHRVRNVHHTEGAAERCDVVGPICETGDFLARDVDLQVAEGDLLVISEVGAYGYVMASNYNFRGRAPEIWIENGKATVARRRETLDDLFRCDEA